MNTVEAVTLGQAMDAWRVAGLHIPNADEAVLPSLCNPAEWFPEGLVRPAAYNLTDQNAGYWSDLIEKWNEHAPKETLERQLGRYGGVAATHILGEYILLAKQNHQATVAYTAAKCLVGAHVEHPETVLTMWDNGRPYKSATALQRRFQTDTFWDLRTVEAVHHVQAGSENEDLESAVAPTVIVRNVAELFDGTLTILSGKHRLDVTYDQDEGYIFNRRRTLAITGNLLVARLPHVAQAARNAA